MPTAFQAAPGYQPATLGDAPPTKLDQAVSLRSIRRIVEIINNMLRGRLNVTLQVTLIASAASTTVTDARISAYCSVVMTPLTADAAAEIGNGTIYVSSQQSGSLVLTHANNTQGDRKFTLAFVG